jgi:hypothetical protein
MNDLCSSSMAILSVDFPLVMLHVILIGVSVSSGPLAGMLPALAMVVTVDIAPCYSDGLVFSCRTPCAFLWKLLYPRVVLGILLEYDSTELAPNVRNDCLRSTSRGSGDPLSELNLAGGRVFER